MCNRACIEFGKRALREEDVRGKKVIEVGSRIIEGGPLGRRGSLRFVAESLYPACYIGVDIEEGNGVDEICNARCLADRWGQDAFDVLISTELLEHVRDWRAAVSNFKQVLRPGGIMIITTRSIGFGYHGFPYDFWRYEIADMEAIFSDLLIEMLEADPSAPGVFMTARKPVDFREKNLETHRLFSIVCEKRVLEVNNWEIFVYGLLHPIPSLVYLRNYFFKKWGLPY
jgi:SAM-dependent methyltransferase